MKKWIVIRLNPQRILCALWEDCRILSLDVFDSTKKDERLGSIFMGKVKNVLPDIHSAFVEYLPGKCGYMDLRSIPGSLRIGDELCVQIQREAVKSKEPVLSGNIQLSGRYCVVMKDPVPVSISEKITDETWRSAMKEKIQGYLARNAEGQTKDYYVPILRTNAFGAPESEVFEEYEALCAQMKKLLTESATRTAKTLIRKNDEEYCLLIRDSYGEMPEEILTDDSAIYDELVQSLSVQNPKYAEIIRLAVPKKGDYLSLADRFNLSRELEHAMDKYVHLPSGAYLVIEQTEAMTVIDVNSGKNVTNSHGRKTEDEVFLKINMEAAKECARQLRLRNLSGMILIDFIDMKGYECNRTLIDGIKEFLKDDPVKTVFVDMTKLGIVEITRKRVRRPLSETMKNYVDKH